MGAYPSRGLGPLAMARMLQNSTLVDRARLAAWMGRSYPDPVSGLYKRNLYETLGYPYSIEFVEYLARYARGDIAKTIVEAPVTEAWRLPPELVEDEDPEKETEFEAAWQELDAKLGVLYYLERADLLAGIGRHGGLLLGFDDGQDLSQPVTPGGGRKLLYLAAYGESSLQVDRLDDNTRSPRYNLPLLYKLQPGALLVDGKPSTAATSQQVHWTRVIHMAEGLLEDDIYGTPRLRPVWNRLLDLEKVAGGSGEMFWQGALPGMHFNLDPEFTFDEDTTDTQGRTPKQAQEDEIKEYLHGLKRYIRTQGIDLKQLMPTVADPSKHIDAQFQLISVTTRIPKRILVGSERGELASTQDEEAWMRHLDRRRQRYLSPRAVRPTVDRLIEFGVLPKPKQYDVSWPPLQDTKDKDKAEIGERVANAIAKYASAPGAEAVLPIGMFLELVIGLAPDQVKTALAEREKVLDEEEEEIRRAEEEQRRADEEARRSGRRDGLPDARRPGAAA